MSKYLKCFFLILLFFKQVHGYANGSGASNNAWVISCPDAAFLLDTWEPTHTAFERVKHDLSSAFREEECQEQENLISMSTQHKLKLILWNEISRNGKGNFPSLTSEMGTISKKLRFTDDDLRERKDFGPNFPAKYLFPGLAYPKECELKTVANWIDGQNRLIVNLPLFEKLSKNDRASLFLHEALYKRHRVRHSVDHSSSIRRMIFVLNILTRKIYQQHFERANRDNTIPPK